MNPSILLGPLCLWGAIGLIGPERFGVYSAFWWMLHLFLFRDSERPGYRGVLVGLRRASWTWLPLGLCWFIDPFAKGGEWFPWDRQMFVAALTLISASWQSILLSFRTSWEGSSRLTLYCLIAASLLWLPFHTAKPVFDLLNFRGTIDVMIFHSIASNLSQANGLLVSFFHPTKHFLGGHFSPLLYLVLAPYSLWPSVAYLVSIQAIALVGASFALYGLAVSATGHRLFAGAISVSFLFHPMLQGVQYAWFHEISFAPVTIFTCVWLWFEISKDVAPKTGGRSETPSHATLWPEKGLIVWPQTVVFVLLWLLALSIKEDASVVMLFVGFTILISNRSDRLVWALNGLTLAWVVWVMMFYLPSHGVDGKYAYFDRVNLDIANGSGLASRVWNLLEELADRVFKEDKFRYLLHMGIPLGFLWVRGGWWLLPAIPVFGWIALSNNWLEYAFFPCQYPTLPLTTMYLATVGAAHRRIRTKGTSPPRSLNRWAYVIFLSGVAFNSSLADSRVDEWVSPSVLRHITNVSDEAKDLRESLETLPLDSTIWCDCSYGHFVKNPAACKMIPWGLQDADPVIGNHLFLVAKAGAPGNSDWVENLIDDPTSNPDWRLVRENPLGNIFEWNRPDFP